MRQTEFQPQQIFVSFLKSMVNATGSEQQNEKTHIAKLVEALTIIYFESVLVRSRTGDLLRVKQM